MKKKLIHRGLLGLPLGVAVGFIITIFISLSIGEGYYAAVKPELIEAMGNEINAVILQTALCGVMGAGFAMASTIWEKENWSLAKQSGIYFAIICAITFPIAYAANWMQHTVAGVLIYIGIFVAIFLIAWLAQYFAWKSKINKMNKGVRNNDKA